MDSNKALELARLAYPNDENLRVAYMLGVDKGYEFCREDIIGIPLTPEILEKNGFSNYADSWYFPPDEMNIRIGFHMYETVLDIKTDSASFYKKIPYGYRSIVKYGNILSVHELQHALKLCGIEKEIVI